jgi:hypothetical protein
MAYSTLYENQAREKIGISPYAELRVALASLNGRSDIYVVAVPADHKVPKIPIVDEVQIGACIDVIVEGEANARKFAEEAAVQSQRAVGMTKYAGQTPAKLQSELDVAQILAKQKGLKTFCYSDWKKTA